MRRIFAALAVLVALLAATAPQAELVKVGLITTLSGSGAGIGADIRDGFLLAVKQSGNSDIVVIVKDDRRKRNVAIQLADKLIEHEKVDVLTGIIWSDLVMAVVPSVLDRGVFYISPNAGPSALSGEGCHENYFNVAWQNDNLPEAAGAFANATGFKNSFILVPNYSAGRDMLIGYKRFFSGSLAGEVYSHLGQTDYSEEIARIRASGADSVFFFLPGEMGISFMQQYANSGVNIPLIGPAFSFDQGILQVVGEAALGVKNTSQWNKDIDNEVNIAFVESFQAEYDRLPSLYASQGFDTANLLLSALRKTSVKNADRFRAALEEADFASTRGDFTFGSNHHPVQNIYVREVIKESGVFTNKTIGIALLHHSDAYAAECDM